MNQKKQSTLRRHLRCINCNICVNTLRRFVVLNLDTKIISVISSWISPLIITDDDYICEACWKIAIQAVNDALDLDNSGEQQAAASSQKGHRLVCILCGLSLLRRQSDLILKVNASDLERNIANIIQANVSPRQITLTDRVCHPCWLRSKHTALHTQPANDTQSLTPEVVNDAKLSEQDLQQTVKIEESKIQGVPVQQEIFLPDYRRAANTASHCIFPGCTNDRLQTMSDSLRATVLSNNKYYIPVLARICAEHLRSNNWDNLYNSQNSISTFTVQQIEHVFSFINAFKP